MSSGSCVHTAACPAACVSTRLRVRRVSPGLPSVAIGVDEWAIGARCVDMGRFAPIPQTPDPTGAPQGGCPGPRCCPQ